MAQHAQPPDGAVVFHSVGADGKSRFKGWRVPGDPLIRLRNEHTGHVELCHLRDLMEEGAWDTHVAVRTIAGVRGISYEAAARLLQELVAAHILGSTPASSSLSGPGGPDLSEDSADGRDPSPSR